MPRRTLAVAAVALGALLGTGPAAAVAHPSLVQAAPTPGLVAPTAPDAIRLALSEPMVARGSSIELLGPRDERVALSGVTTGDGGRSLSVTPDAPLRSAVYRVRWKALGDDGHQVGGTFSFGVAGPEGAPPPGAEALEGAGASGRGGETQVGESILSILAEWLGIAAASAMLGGAAFVALLRRRDADLARRAAERLLPLAAPAWLLLALAVSEGVLSAAAAGPGDALDLGLLTESASGTSQLARAGLVVLASVVLAAVARRRAAGAVYGSAGALVLVSYALSGHVLVGVGALEVVAQVAHVLAAGLWLGGVLALVVVARGGDVRLAAGARALAPLAGGALAVAVLTGVLAALREVDRWYLLRWSDYGNVVLVKAALVGVVALAGLVTWRRTRTARAPRPVLVRAELAGVLAVVALATTLGGISQGRGRPLPAQDGNVLPGAAFATALLPDGPAPIGLAPARTGANTVTVQDARGLDDARQVDVRLSAGTGEDVRAALRRTRSGAWTGRVDLPADGRWYGYVSVDGRRAAAPVLFTVGVPDAPGRAPRQLLVSADLSGPGAPRCRAHVQGLQTAAGRINAEGGVDGGRKLAPLVLDDGGDPGRSASVVRAALAGERPVAAAGCGGGAVAGLAVAGREDVPVVIGDPAIEPVAGPGAFRLAADPYAQGVALAQYLTIRVLPTAAAGVRTIRTAIAGDVIGRRVLAGLRAGLRDTGVRVDALRPGELAGSSTARLRSLLDRRRSLALVLDGPDGDPDQEAVAALARRGRTFPPAPVLGSTRTLSERLILRFGELGRVGVLQGVSEVSTQTAEALVFQRTLPLLFPGERPSLDGLRGYAAGLALRAGLRGDVDPDAVRSRLRTPPVFTDALLSPWPADAPGKGTPALLGIAPQFLASTLTPASAGGEAYSGTWFEDGAWTNTSVRPIGLRPGEPTPGLERSSPGPRGAP